MHKELLEEIKKDLEKMSIDVFCSTKIVKSIIVKIEKELEKPERQPLTDDEISKIGWTNQKNEIEFARAIEKHHGIKK